MKCLILMSFMLLTACASGVIGVSYNQRGVVRYVFKNSPAELAGVKLDDRILNTKQLRGKVGSTALVKINRNDTYLELSIIRCDIDDLQDPSKVWK